MPTTREEHIVYTREELKNYPYYVKLFDFLKNEKIKSYIDIGSNVGEYCNYLNEYVPTMEVSYLIEPEIKNYDFMLKNLKYENCNSFNCAIAYGFSSGNLIDMYNNVGGFILEKSESGTISVKTLEELNIPLTDFIKIDVEGGEFNIIENSTQLKDTYLIDIEFHNHLSVTGMESIDYVKKWLPNHEVVYYDEHPINLYGRLLLKKKINNG